MDRERLVVTWFTDAGENHLTRTSFVEERIPLEKLVENRWTTPKKIDFPKTTARMFMVIRDGRGGVSWLARTVELKE